MGSQAISRRKTELRNNRKKQQNRNRIVWGGIGVGIALIVGVLVWNAARPSTGESIPIPAGFQNHIPIGSDPGQYTSNPPAGGLHYPETIPAGFYDETEAAAVPQYPQGYLVHDLEHGYVIFWYNCGLVDADGCGSLKESIQSVMDEFDNYKLIAFPWSTSSSPLVMTSWGKLLEMDRFNANSARNFIRSNLNRSPEPNAP